MKKERVKLIKKHKYFGAFIIFLSVCFLISIFCFQYYNKLQDTIRDESRGYLQEVTQRIGTNVNNIIENNYAVLYTMASVLETSKASSFSEVKPVVDVQRKYWNYEDVMMIGENGVAYNDSGEVMAISGDDYLRNTIVNKEQSMSTSQVINNNEYIIFTIPLNNIVIDGNKMVALACTYSPDAFSNVLDMTAFNGLAFTQIISKEGTIIIRSSSPVARKMGYNVISSLANSEIHDNGSVEKLKSDILKGFSGQISYTLNDVKKYMVYTPLGQGDWYLLTFVPVDVVNERSNMLLNITLLICGLITLLFAGLISFLGYVYIRNKNKLEQIAYVDLVTGGHTIQKFYELAQTTLEESNRPQYALVFTNMQKFKVLNEQFGRNTCDAILYDFNYVINTVLDENEHVGRISADNFCILMKFKDEETILERFKLFYYNAETYIRAKNPIWQMPITQFGIYIINNDTMTFPIMIDRAKLALKESPRFINNKLCYAIYDDAVRQLLFREKQLEDVMETALNQREFQVYLQPKYRTTDDKIGGAEALSRWISPTEGMIYPDEFIPLFEKNGFIIQLDLWVFEEVCQLIRSWLDAGKEPIKISINCSRFHLKDSGFLRKYKEISHLYNVPPKYIEIELTESIVMEDSQRLINVIDEIHSAGFGCSMDDFGSGYSSLNLIQEISVDTLKIDKIFFNVNSNSSPERMQSVVSGIVNMAKALDMETVAEGVEEVAQVEMLKKIGCDLIQGYVFAKPMSIADFERLVENEQQ